MYVYTYTHGNNTLYKDKSKGNENRKNTETVEKASDMWDDKYKKDE